MPKDIKQNNVEPTIKFNQHADGANEILIYGVIGDSYWDDVNSKAFFDQMQALEGSDVTVRINSYGGSVVAGTAIHTMLALHKGQVTAQIDGYAMSMASVIAMAADKIEISEIGGFMIHSPWTFAAGSADELRKEADVLDGMEASLINAYHSKTGIDKTELAQMLKDETWIYADEAVEKGFADSTIKPVEANACFDKSIEGKLENMPDAMAQFIAMHEEAEEESEETPDEIDPVTEERARNKSIMAACRAAGLSHLAESYIDKGYALDVVQDLITEIKAGREEAPPVQQVSTNQNSSASSLWEGAQKAAGLKSK